MNLRATILLIGLAVAVGVVAYINPFKGDEASRDDSPWFYRLAEDDIERLEITHRGVVEVFTIEDGRKIWEFVEPAGIPPAYERFGGIPYFFSGPKTKRDLTIFAPTIEDPAQYGLDNPFTVVDVSLTANRHLQFRLGDVTPNGGHNYAQVVGFPQLYIIAATWADVVTRLVTDKPLPRWYIKRKPELVVGLNVILGNPDDPLKPTKLEFEKDRNKDIWTVTDRSIDRVDVPIDPDRWETILPLLGGPPGVYVIHDYVDDYDYEPWGIGDLSNGIEIRFSGESERGTHFIDGDAYVIGHKTPDGRAYYARSERGELRAPILSLDAEWVETLLALHEDVPYGEQEEQSEEPDPGLTGF